MSRISRCEIAVSRCWVMKWEKRAKASTRVQNLGHVFLLARRFEEILRFVHEPQVRVSRSSGENALPDVRQDEPKQEEAHSSGNAGTRAVHQDDLALVLEPPEIGSRRAAQR